MKFGKEIGTWNFWIKGDRWGLLIDWQSLAVIFVGLVCWTAIDLLPTIL